MSMISATIGGISVTIKDQSFTIVDGHGVRSTLNFVVIDSLGAYSFSRGMPVIFTDNMRGNLYKGTISKSNPEKPAPDNPLLLHTVTIVDSQYLVDKRVNITNYTGYYAGDIIADGISNVLHTERVAAPYSRRRETFINDFNTGTLNGTIGLQTTNGSAGDGDLELAKAGADLTITEKTTANFATGALTNMVASNNSLMPSTVNALKMESTLSFSYGTEFANTVQVATGSISGTANGSLSGGSISGSLSGGSISGSINGGSINGTANGNVYANVNASGSFYPSGSISISGGASGESASFNGNSGTVNTSGSFSTGVTSTVSGSCSGSVSGSASGSVSGSCSGSVSAPFSTTATMDVTPQYIPKTKSVVKVDKTHYPVATVDLAVADNRVDATIWTGSQTIGSHDTLNYDVFISSISPNVQGGVDLVFSDGTTMTEYLGSLGKNNDTGIWDQNLVSISPITDLSDYAKDTWYTRNIDLSIVSGKVVTSVTMFNAGNIAGTFDIFIKNCYLGSHSGTPFFSPSQTAPTTNPPIFATIGAYITNATQVTVLPVYLPAANHRVSAAYSIDSVKLVRSSLITWTASVPVVGPAVIVGTNAAIATVQATSIVMVSYDGTTWLSCVNNKPLPGLPAGANCAGMSLYLYEAFSGGQDPTAIPSLLAVTITIASAPHATTADIATGYGTTAAWNTGAMIGVAPNAQGDLALGITPYSWSNLGNMTFVPATGPSGHLPTQSVSGGTYIISSLGSKINANWSSSRFNFISAVKDFTASADFTLNSSSPNQNEIGFIYRQTFWGAPNNSFAYYVRIMQAPSGQAGGTSISLGIGVNSPPSATSTLGAGTGSYTTLVQKSATISNNVTYHLKLVVSQNRHTVYWNNSTTPIIDILDNTYTAAGNVGIRTYYDSGSDSDDSGTAKIANFSITNTYAGIWTSPSINLNSLGIIGNAQVAWSEVNSAYNPQSTVIVQSSINGGSTWQQCTNASLAPAKAIPGLPIGANTTAISLLIRIIMSATGFLPSPVIMGLYVRVCDSYPGSSGTRTSVPLGNDYQPLTRTVGSGWGSAYDGQAWAQTGTALTSVSGGEARIGATTGDVHMALGITGTDEDVTYRFWLPSSTYATGLEIRYTDANNHYRLTASTTTISIIKKRLGITTTLSSVTSTLTTGTWYRMRFRVVGSDPVFLYGNIWQDGMIEPNMTQLPDPVTGLPLSMRNSAWTIQAGD